MSPSADERRRAVRVDAALKLEVNIPREGGDPQLATLETLNISSSGIYFKSDHFIEPMTKLDMELELPIDGPQDKNVTTASCEGIVVRVLPEYESPETDQYEVAVFFTRISDDGIEHLQNHISHLLES